MPGSGSAPIAARTGASLRADAGQIRLGEQLVVYALNRRRRRSIGFVVGPGGLTINAPSWLGRAEIDAALQAKSRWILTKLDEQRERSRRVDAARIEWGDGCVLPVLGRATRLALGGAGFGLVDDPVKAGGSEADPLAAARTTPGAGGSNRARPEAPSVPEGPESPETRTLHTRQPLRASETPDAALPRACLVVPLPVDAAPARIQAAVCRWLQAEARRLFAERTARYAPQLDVRPIALRLSSARTRWGSASADGTIRLNWRLIHLPVECIDYVVVHELAHLREMNHGPRFWALVAAVLPHYEAVRRTLRSVPIPAPDRQ